MIRVYTIKFQNKNKVVAVELFKILLQNIFFYTKWNE